MEFPISDYSDNWKTEIKSNLPLCCCSVCFPLDCTIPKKKPTQTQNDLEAPDSNFSSPWAEKRDELFPAFQHGDLQTSPVTSLSLLEAPRPFPPFGSDSSQLFPVIHRGRPWIQLCFPATDLPTDDSSCCFHWQRGIVNLWLTLGFLFLTFPYPPNPIRVYWLGTEAQQFGICSKGWKKTGIKWILPPLLASGIPSH